MHGSQISLVFQRLSAATLCLALFCLSGGCTRKSPVKTTAGVSKTSAGTEKTTQHIVKTEVALKTRVPTRKTSGQRGEKKTPATSQTETKKKKKRPQKTVAKKTAGKQPTAGKDTTQPKGGKKVPSDPRQQALARFNELGADVRFNSQKNVSAIDFRETEVTDADLALLVHFPYLHELDLSHTQVTDAGMKHLAKVKRLAKLVLFATDVTDKGIEELAPLNRLEFLCLDETKITDRALETVGKWEDLEVLHLQSRDRSKITDAGLKHLLGLRFLKELKISGTAVTAQGVQRVQQAIPGCKIR